MNKKLNEKLINAIEVFIGIFVLMLFVTFGLICLAVPLLLTFVYSGWYILLCFISIPLFFAIASFID